MFYGGTAWFNPVSCSVRTVVAILLVKGSAREMETYRWDRVNWSWHVSSVCVSTADTWLSPICLRSLIHSLHYHCYQRPAFHTTEGRYQNHDECISEMFACYIVTLLPVCVQNMHVAQFLFGLISSSNSGFLAHSPALGMNLKKKINNLHQVQIMKPYHWTTQ